MAWAHAANPASDRRLAQDVAELVTSTALLVGPSHTVDAAVDVARCAPAGPAIAGVLVFRLATFWLPIAPGWLAFRRLRRSGAI